MTHHRTTGTSGRSRYEHADFFLLRAPALPVGTFEWLMEPIGPADGDDELRGRARARLRSLAAEPEVRHALAVASGDLVEALSRLERDPEATEKKTRRVYSRLLRYLTRMATRPTPFGRFCGVAMGDFGAATTARLGRPVLRHSRIRADMGWLLGLIKKLESDPELRPNLRVTLNSTAYPSGDRVLLPYADVYGEKDNRSIRIRATAAVAAVMRLAATPIPYGRLADELGLEFPRVDRATVTGLIEQMWELNFLTSDLRPPLTTPFPEQYVAKQLSGIPAAAGAVDALEEITDLAQRAANGRTDLLGELASRQRALVPEHTGPTYQLDSAIDLRATGLTDAVGRAISDAVDCLMRLSEAVPGHNHHLVRYRDAFTERYGLNALVPVLEVLAPDGLEAPPTYTEPARVCPLPPAPSPDSSEYDRVLTELAAGAWWRGQHEVELTDAWLERLAPPPPEGEKELPLYPALDVYAQLQVRRPGADLDREPWRLVLREEVLAYGGRTYGRFFDLLGEDGVERLRGYARREEALSPGAVHAELCYFPSVGRATNVALRPRLRDYQIPINCPPTVAPHRVLTLEDLFVGATEDRLFLWSRRLGREVVVSQSHMLSPQFAPNVARFLLEASTDGYVVPTGFRWAGLSSMPFLPRVVRGNVVLHPAQWTLDAATLTELAPADFGAAVGRWRHRWRVPRHVYLVDDDNRLLLDLDHPTSRDELEQELSRGHRRVTVHEMLPGLDQNWLSDEEGHTYLGEVVAPLVVSDPAHAARSAPPSAGPGTLDEGSREGPYPRRRHLPGGAWTFLKIYSSFARHDEIIASALRPRVAALREQGLVDRWHYLRYADPWPHLRVRFRGREGITSPALLAHLTGWARSLVEQGLAFDSAVSGYAPEIERYGGPRAFDAVERLFEVNSDVTAELVALLDRDRDEMEPAHVGVAAVDALYTQWGLDTGAKLRLLPTGHESSAVHAEFRRSRDYLCELIAPWDPRPHERGRTHHERLAPVLAAQADAVAAVATAATAAEDARWGTPASILGSLAHMQVNRLMEIDLHREARCYALWRHALRAVRGRPTGI